MDISDLRVHYHEFEAMNSSEISKIKWELSS